MKMNIIYKNLFSITPAMIFALMIVSCKGEMSSKEDPSTEPTTPATYTNPHPETDEQSTGYVVKISVGGTHSCALMSDDRVKCWGSRFNDAGGGAITRSISSEILEIETAASTYLSGVIDVSAGTGHTCVIMGADRSVKCWGANNSGQLGDGTNTFQKDYVITSVTDGAGGSLTGVVALSSSGRIFNDDIAGAVARDWGHTCALLNTGKVKCWGYNAFYQLGNETTVDATEPVTVGDGAGGDLEGVTAISVGPRHSCALLEVGSAVCWGDNTYDQLGDTPATPGKPVYVSNGAGGVLTTITQISAGMTHTCARLSSGRVKCWGANQVTVDSLTYDTGALGNETNVSSATPVNVLDGSTAILANVSSVASAGNYYKKPNTAEKRMLSNNCAIVSGGEVKCWGSNQYGSLGDETTTTRLYPVSTGLTGAVQISGGGGVYCALLSNKKVYCWGPNQFAQAGRSAALYYTYVPYHISDLNPITSNPGASLTKITLGNYHACVLKDDGSVKCWGRNDGYELSGGGASTPTPKQVTTDGTTPVLGALDVEAGGNHTCIITSDNKVMCWGRNSVGELGDGTNTNRQYPTYVSDGLGGQLSGVSKISANGRATFSDGGGSLVGYTCALMDVTGEVKCWGLNFNKVLGNGTAVNSNVPVTVGDGLGGNLSGVTAISAGVKHVCALMTDTTVKCWGNNSWGQLGTGNTVNSDYPTTVQASLGVDLTGVVSISVGYMHSCALLNDDSVKCWGTNTQGMLGTGNTVASYYAANTAATSVMQLSAMGNAYEPFASYGNTCALLTNNTVECVGTNSHGNLGLGGNLNLGAYSTSMAAVNNITNAVYLANKNASSCVITVDDKVKCWGTNRDGITGIAGAGDFGLTSTPNIVTGI
jgi:alpha-tubulin suppressor-like RCC1 family protein